MIAVALIAGFIGFFAGIVVTFMGIRNVDLIEQRRHEKRIHPEDRRAG